jgi:hypothetical protein
MLDIILISGDIVSAFNGTHRTAQMVGMAQNKTKDPKTEERSIRKMIPILRNSPRLGILVHACNPSYSGGRERRIQV